ncbi:MAG: aminopeptidase P family protein [Verrucomicrobia bacterium]|nr:aminopeptidase P family protein [Verrucomicrobiota bacterium]
MSRENLLMFASSESDANMLYALGLFILDPFIYLRVSGKNYVVIGDLELERVRKQARHCQVLPLSRYLQRSQRDGVKRNHTARVISMVLRERRLKKVVVPVNFSLGLARELRDLKIKVKVKKGGFFPQREIKTGEEVKKISAALMMAEVGLAEGIQALKSSKASRDGRLLYHNLPLTAEKLRSIIDIAILQAGGTASRSIVAAGKQGCDPHERGYGPLRANQPIILDVFPRSQKTGYFGDITRTVVKGRATEGVRKLYHTVARGQETVLQQIQHGKSGKEIHRCVQDLFEREGYKTSKCNGRMQGFFHSTGHGLGLEMHELPRINQLSDDVLKAGNVVTVEPGLYYPELGGVRLEDVVLVTHNGPRNLTKFEKVLEV